MPFEEIRLSIFGNLSFRFWSSLFCYSSAAMLKVLDGDAASDFEIWSGGDQISTAEEGEEG